MQIRVDAATLESFLYWFYQMLTAKIEKKNFWPTSGRIQHYALRKEAVYSWAASCLSRLPGPVSASAYCLFKDLCLHALKKAVYVWGGISKSKALNFSWFLESWENAILSSCVFLRCGAVSYISLSSPRWHLHSFIPLQPPVLHSLASPVSLF